MRYSGPFLIAALAAGFAAGQMTDPRAVLLQNANRHFNDDPAAAVRDITKIAEQGFAPAEYELCTLYLAGRAVEMNRATARDWCRRAADHGSSVAAFKLGQMALDGEQTPLSIREALDWFRQSAEAGRPEAQTALGVMYVRGTGLTADAAEGVRWLERAAKQGYRPAQAQLAQMYEIGDGVTKDLRTALAYWLIAQPDGNPSSEAARLEKQLAPGDVDAARQMAAAMRSNSKPLLGIGAGTDSRAAAPLDPPVYRIGGSVLPPVPKFRREPDYTEEARRASVSGAVLLSLVIDASGMPRDIKIIRRLGYGLDEKAIEAVQRWRFKPATKDGTPVAVMVNVEVNFRLMRGNVQPQ